MALLGLGLPHVQKFILLLPDVLGLLLGYHIGIPLGRHTVPLLLQLRLQLPQLLLQGINLSLLLGPLLPKDFNPPPPPASSILPYWPP